MSAQHTPGPLGPIDHFANVPRHISVGMVGRSYRVVASIVVNGERTEEPLDDRLFDSVREARKAAAIAKATGAA